MIPLYLMAAGDAMEEFIGNLFHLACGASFGIIIVTLWGIPS